MDGPSGEEMTLRSARFASMADPQLLVLWAEVGAGAARAQFAAGAEERVAAELRGRA